MRKVFVLIISSILSFFIWATITSAGENIKVDLMLKEFINSATYVEDVSDDKIKYYVVKSEEKLDVPTYTLYRDKVCPGNVGDIILTKISAIEIPVLHEILSFYTGGHAALCAGDYNDDNLYITVNDTMEVTGFGSDITVNEEPKFPWLNGHYDLIMAVRVKTSFENRFRAFNRAISFYGQEYNFSFMFNKNTQKYCSDLVSQSYEYVGIDLDYDNVAGTVMDLLANPHVYLTYVSFLDPNNVRHTYILSD